MISTDMISFRHGRSLEALPTELLLTTAEEERPSHFPARSEVIRMIAERDYSSLLNERLAYQAVRDALIDASQTDMSVPPVAFGEHGAAGSRLSIRSAMAGALTGTRMSGYWPDNEARGLPGHSSTLVLLDQKSGRVSAVIEASLLHAYRAAASNAVAVDALARQDASTLAIFGAGNQALFDVLALAQVRTIKRVLVVARDRVRVEGLCHELERAGIAAEAASPESAVLAAEIIVTSSCARSPWFDASWVRPGTHISAMGSEGTGKRELPPRLLAIGRLYADLASQSRLMGEFQHAPASTPVIDLGHVLTGTAAGRTRCEDITVFDSTGLALQDLYIAQAVLDRMPI